MVKKSARLNVISKSCCGCKWRTRSFRSDWESKGARATQERGRHRTTTTIFGVENVQATPQPGNFPLLGLEKKKVALLDGWCFDADVLPLARQLVWYEGKPFPLTRPQNLSTCSGQILYRGTAPVFVTCKDSCKEKDLAPAQDKAHVAVVRGSS